jgi:hypothetical protein
MKGFLRTTIREAHEAGSRTASVETLTMRRTNRSAPMSGFLRRVMR